MKSSWRVGRMAGGMGRSMVDSASGDAVGLEGKEIERRRGPV